MRPILLRMLGVRIGRGVFDDGCVIPERSLVTIGEHTSLGAGSVIQGHSLEDGAFKTDRIVVGSKSVIGVGAFVHYGTTIGDRVVVETDSFLMKGQEVPSGERWAGNPAQPAARPSAPVAVRPAAIADAVAPGPLAGSRSRPALRQLDHVPSSPSAATLLKLGVTPITPFGPKGLHLAVLDLPPCDSVDSLSLDDLEAAGLPVDLLDAGDRCELEGRDDQSHRARSAAARVLARLCLTGWWHQDIDPGAWRLERTVQGQVVVVGPATGLHLDVVHTGRLVAVATSNVGPVGVGVEPEPALDRLGDAAQEVLSETEKAWLDALPSAGQGHALARIRTVKAAVAQALGFGAGVELRDIEAALDPPRAWMTGPAGNGVVPNHVEVAQWPLTVDGQAQWLTVAAVEERVERLPVEVSLPAWTRGRRGRPRARHPRQPDNYL